MYSHNVPRLWTPSLRVRVGRELLEGLEVHHLRLAPVLALLLRRHDLVVDLLDLCFSEGLVLEVLDQLLELYTVRGRVELLPFWFR